MENLINTIEEVVSLTLPSGEYSKSIDFTPPKGKVIALVIYKDENFLKEANGFIRAEIKDSMGKPISKFQHIDNYRSRDNAEYAKSGKPVNVATNGQSYTYSLLATEQQGEDFKTELILVYEEPKTACEY